MWNIRSSLLNTKTKNEISIEFTWICCKNQMFKFTVWIWETSGLVWTLRKYQNQFFRAANTKLFPSCDWPAWMLPDDVPVSMFPLCARPSTIRSDRRAVHFHSAYVCVCVCERACVCGETVSPDQQYVGTVLSLEDVLFLVVWTV